MTDRWRRSRVLVALAAAVLAGPAPAQVVTEFRLPAGVRPNEIAPGPGGMWFTEVGRNRIGLITPEGQVTEFPINRPARSIVAGPDGNLWFTSKGFLTRMTPQGQVTDLPIAGEGLGITVGADGQIWFTETGSTFYGALGCTTPWGQVLEFKVGALAYDIVLGRDGNLWLTDEGDFWGGIVRVTPDGTETYFGTGWSDEATLGPDGNVWFNTYRDTVGRITPTGAMVEYYVPGTARGITSGPDGHLWIALEDHLGRHTIGRMSTQGDFREISLPTNDADPWDIATAPDGSIWFTERRAGRIGRITLNSAPGSLSLAGGRFLVTATWSSPTGSGVGRPVSLSQKAGYFWFYEPSNVEVVVKALDGCPAGAVTFYAAGLTNLEVSLTLTDAVSGDSRTWVNPQGTPFMPVQETLPVCLQVPSGDLRGR